MDLVIYKSILELDIKLDDRGLIGSVEFPKGARVISAQLQHGVVAIWAICNPEEPVERYYLMALPTGLPTDLLTKYETEFVATIMALNGNVVFHIFLIKNPGESLPVTVNPAAGYASTLENVISGVQ
jgi:hypothetical protein